MQKKEDMKRTLFAFLLVFLLSYPGFSEIIRKTTKFYSGEIPKEITYYDGKKEIVKELLDEEGKISKLGVIPDGIVKEYYMNGRVRNEWVYKNNKRNGVDKFYDYDGKLLEERTFKDDKQDGICRTFYETGQLQKEQYKKDYKQEGFCRTFYESGKLMGELTYRNGVAEGIEKEYYENGRLESILNYINGKREGVEIKYYRSGKTAKKCSYKNDKKDGVEESFYEQGQLESVCEHSKGEKNGLEKYFFENGNLKTENLYLDGKIFYWKEYEEDGKLLKDEKYGGDYNFVKSAIIRLLVGAPVCIFVVVLFYGFLDDAKKWLFNIA